MCSCSFELALQMLALTKACNLLLSQSCWGLSKLRALLQGHQRKVQRPAAPEIPACSWVWQPGEHTKAECECTYCCPAGQQRNRLIC